MRVGRLLLLALSLWAGGTAARAQDEDLEDLREREVKECQGLLRGALKASLRRQAWYFAGRLLELEPDHRDARAARAKWSVAELQGGQDPRPGWLRTRDRDLAKVGSRYAALAEAWHAGGRPPPDWRPLLERALALGADDAATEALLEAADLAWAGSFGLLPRVRYEAWLGDAAPTVVFPPPHDDATLRHAVRWPESRAVAWPGWRLLTDLDAETALPLVARLAEVERWLTTTLGRRPDRAPDPEPTDLLLFRDVETYDAVGGALFEELGLRWLDPFEGTSGYYDPWSRFLLVSWHERHNAWIPPEAHLAGEAARVLVRRHLSGGAGGLVRGRGSWLLGGLAGLFEGLGRAEDGTWTVEPSRCWRLAAARVLREAGLLVEWEEFLELDHAAARAVARRALNLEFAGQEVLAEEVDVVAAQATAFALAVFTSDPAEGPKALADLVFDLQKRDRLPDVDRTLGWKRGRAREEFERILGGVSDD